MSDEIGLNRKRGHPDTGESKKIEKQCEQGFNDGDPILYTAAKYKINKNTVNKYYKKFRADMSANMDKEFITEQKYHKAQAMKALRTRMNVLEEQVTKLQEMRDDSMKYNDQISLEKQITTSLMSLSELEQQMHGLGMCRTVDISIRQLVEDDSGKSGNTDTK